MTNTEIGRDLLSRWLALLDDRVLDGVMPASRITLDTRDYLEALGPKLEAKWRKCEPGRESKNNSVFEFLVSLYANTETRINDLGECEVVLPENLIRGWLEEHDAAILKSSPKDAREGRHEPEGSGKKARTIKRMGS